MTSEFIQLELIQQKIDFWKKNLADLGKKNSIGS